MSGIYIWLSLFGMIILSSLLFRLILFVSVCLFDDIRPILVLAWRILEPLGVLPHFHLVHFHLPKVYRYVYIIYIIFLFEFAQVQGGKLEFDFLRA